MISTAEKCNIDNLKDLWRVCFYDEPGYIDFFFDNRFVTSNTLVYTLNNKTVAQLFLLEGGFSVKGNIYPSYYLYAACTHPDFRRKGIMKELLLYAEEISKKRDIDFICLVPAEKSLFDYYSKFSYKSVFSKTRITVAKPDSFAPKLSINAFSLSSDNISLFRNNYLTKHDFFVWSDKAINYAVKENMFSDGSFYVSDYGYALLRPIDKNTGYVIEICSSDGNQNKIIEDLFTEFQFEKLVIDAPCDFIHNKCAFEKVENAMALAVSDKAKKIIDNISGAYFGLPLE